jgi:hypothetical protein
MLKRQLIEYLEAYQRDNPGCFFSSLKIKYLYLRQLQELYDKIQTGDLVVEEPEENKDEKEPEKDNEDEQSESESDNEVVNDNVFQDVDTGDVFSSYSKGEDEVKEEVKEEPKVEEVKEEAKVEEVKEETKKEKKTKVKSEPLKTKKEEKIEKHQKTEKKETTNNIASVRKEIKQLLKDASTDSSKLLRMYKVKKRKYGLDDKDEDLIVEYYNELRADLESEINSLLDTLIFIIKYYKKIF